jgi:hypothetical protein
LCVKLAMAALSSQWRFCFPWVLSVQPVVVRHGGPRSTPLLVRSSLRTSADESDDVQQSNLSEAIPLATLSPQRPLTASLSQSASASFEKVTRVSVVHEEDNRSQALDMAAPVEIAVQTTLPRERQVMTPDSDYHTADQSPSSGVMGLEQASVSQRGSVRAFGGEGDPAVSGPAKAVQQLAMERLTAKLREEQEKSARLEVEALEATQKAKRATAQVKQHEKTIVDLRRQLVCCETVGSPTGVFHVIFTLCRLTLSAVAAPVG